MRHRVGGRDDDDDHQIWVIVYCFHPPVTSSSFFPNSVILRVIRQSATGMQLEERVIAVEAGAVVGVKLIDLVAKGPHITSDIFRDSSVDRLGHPVTLWTYLEQRLVAVEVGAVVGVKLIDLVAEGADNHPEELALPAHRPHDRIQAPAQLHVHRELHL
jgi:hypothetical protein